MNKVVDFKRILSNKDTLNLKENQERLVLKALIKTDFNLPKAFKLNCSENYFTYSAYDKMYRKIFKIGINDLRDQYEEQLKILKYEKSQTNQNIKADKV